MTLSLPIRPRRNRKSPVTRGFMRETRLHTDNLVLPLFIHAGRGAQAINSMPDCFRLDLDGMLREIEGALKEGVRAFDVFPVIPESQKTSGAEESWNPEGLVPNAVRQIKRAFPEALVITDVALDPYNADGHDGLVKHGEILNDETIECLIKQALCHAEAGADVVSPSDMMDGRIGAIRYCLDQKGHSDVSILSYCVKYASALYNPFRDALDSAPRFGDKKTYQMDPGNAREALREVTLDEGEGADILMVKPATFFLDVIRLVRENTALPVAAYHVSGEYSMLKAAALNGWIDERQLVLEALTSIKRAGAEMIFTYYARQAARWLREV
ncbi:MAG TPA: porphobilinogen synthase [Geothrix sp.]|nr:porphobilinogen synthase [Geothrix sp.]